MIDFTNLPTRKKTYTGANGSKISVVYNGDLYMLKFPALSSRLTEKRLITMISSFPLKVQTATVLSSVLCQE